VYNSLQICKEPPVTFGIKLQRISVDTSSYLVFTMCWYELWHLVWPARLLFLIIFLTIFQTNCLKIYRSDLRQVCRLPRSTAAADQPEIGFSTHQGTLLYQQYLLASSRTCGQSTLTWSRIAAIRTDWLIVFARWHQCAPLSNACFRCMLPRVGSGAS